MFKELIFKIISLFLKFPNNPLKNLIREYFYAEIVSERIIEYALVFSFLKYLGDKEKRKVLDVGCFYSNFPIQLASMGFKVIGLDLQDYEFTHPNFKFVKGDIRTIEFKEKFDIVTSISTIEHIGLGFYKEEKDLDGDRKSILAIRKLLKPKGLTFITVPFGKPTQTDSYRSYDWHSLKILFQGLKLKKILFFAQKKGKWIPVSRDKAEKVDNSKKVGAIAFVLAQK